MSEYIGARISLISKSDIRYAGILHSINSDDATVALEQVKSYGTEGRRGGEDEIPPGAATYEYILFRGSDVKDLRIEQAAEKTKPQPPPQVPDDPAILGSARPPPSQPQTSPQQPQQQTQPGHPPFGQFPPYPPMPGQGFGRGFPGGPGGPGGPGFPGFPGVPYGAPPPGWFPPPGQSFPGGPPGPGHMPPQHQMPHAQPGQAQPARHEEQPSSNKDQSGQTKAHSGPAAPVAAKPTQPAAHKAPTPPVESKPGVAAALAPASSPPVAQAAKSASQPSQQPLAPMAQKAKVPIPLPSQKPITAVAAVRASGAQPAAPSTQQYQDATQAATAAVAAAMAKLPGAVKQQATQGDVDNLTQKVQEMRTDDHIRHGRQQGTGGYAAGHRGGRRGAHRGHREHHQAARVQIPDTDFDFESANAKFNKQDLVKEVIASGSPVTSPGGEGANGEHALGVDAGGPATNGDKEDEVTIPPSSLHPAYDKKSSFFDNISSELKGRDETGKPAGGREFRTEERKKNLETFGQGSVDNYRGGYRGRGGRGRGGHRGRGVYRGRGAPRPRGNFATGTSAAAGNTDTNAA